MKQGIPCLDWFKFDEIIVKVDDNFIEFKPI